MVDFDQGLAAGRTPRSANLPSPKKKAEPFDPAFQKKPFIRPSPDDFPYLYRGSNSFPKVSIWRFTWSFGRNP
jgi:hypothetical protein